MKENAFQKQLLHLYEENEFLKFDEFIVRKFAEIEEGERITEDIRRQAYNNFYQQIGKVEIASSNTMRRWFGLLGYAKPSRMQVYEMAFLLKLTREETEEYLMRGLGETSFQINDYHEIIYLYGLDNHLDMKECQKMIRMFERNLGVKQEFLTTRNTEQLQKKYEQKKTLSIQEFLMFMVDNVEYFKGYSKTTLSYLIEYRNQVLRYIRKDAKRRLEDWLSETDYKEWKKKNSFLKKGTDYDWIRRYVKANRNGSMSKMMADNVLELSKIAYSTLDNNSLVHAEIYNNVSGVFSKSKHSQVRNMSMKHMSDILHVAEKKEQASRILAAVWCLEGMDEREKCPLDITELLAHLSKDEKRKWTCKDALLWLQDYDKENKRRQLHVQRGDLLPFVLYVSQQRYLEQIHGDMAQYKQGEAKEIFSQAADNVLTACNMLPLDEKWELDAVLLACYQEEEMYAYPDVLEALYG